MKRIELNRKRLACTAAWLGGLLVAGLLGYQQWALHELTGALKSNASEEAFESLNGRISTLEHRAERMPSLPDSATKTELLQLQETLDKRLATLTSQLDQRALVTDLRSVERSVTAEREAAHQAIAARPVKRPTKPSRKKAVLQSPPFRLLGLELRGGQRFLAISPAADLNLDQVQLLRTGDQFQSWRLDSIESTSVVFQVNGKPQRLALP